MIRRWLWILLLGLLPEVAAAQCGNLNCVMCYGLRARRYTAPSVVYPPSYRAFPPQAIEIPTTPQNVVDAMLEAAKLTPSDVLYDLGCGDGRICKTAAETYGCQAVGIEIDPERARIASANCAGLPVRIVTGDARKFHLYAATVVTMYLERELMEELVPKVENTARLIVSYSHPVPGHDNRRIMVDSKHPIYVVALQRPSGAPVTVRSPGGWRKVIK